MRVLAGREAACRATVLCSSTAVRSSGTTARPRPQRQQPAGEGPSSRPEPLLVCLPVVGPASSASGPGSLPWQLSYWPAAQPQLLPRRLAFVELQDAPQLRVQLGEPRQQLQEQQEQQQQQQGAPPPPDEKHKDYYANVGDCIRTLREDIPLLFHKDLNYSIYREDMVFLDPRISFRGLRNYKLVITSLRFHGKLFFKQPMVEVIRIWQPEDNIIKMRWTVHGCPRLWWTERSTFDGISTYKLDRNGRIYEHAIDNMQLRDPPITNPLLYGWNFLSNTVYAPQQQPCPGAWFRDHDEEESHTSFPTPAGQQ